jgi:chromatin remodeling complex protein RSC6
MVRAANPTTTTTPIETPKATVTKTTKATAPKAKATAPKATAPKATKAKATKEVAATPVIVETIETAPVNVVVQEPTTLEQKIAEFSAKLQQLSSIFSSLKGDFKTLEKGMGRELKASQKAAAKKIKRAGNRQPSGFVKPTRISDELANFLGKDIGTEMARTAVSKEINEYIVANGLQNKDNGRFINPDAKLTTLLNIQSGDTLSYFNLQTYMKHHFIKQATANA